MFARLVAALVFKSTKGLFRLLGLSLEKSHKHLFLQPIFPPVGLNDNQLDPIQRELLAYCNQIQPSYIPILSVEKYEGRNLIVCGPQAGRTDRIRLPVPSLPRRRSTTTSSGDIPAPSK